ncbi:MAG: hypothetical protein CL840_16200 [Crocinitomicaceae bacterium]|nr:hypothetical protein [Crocinitomicaceae bacterium]
MGTRALIAAYTTRKQIESTYIFSDGYLEYTGKFLVKHYNNEGLAREVCEIGYISCLRETAHESEISARDKMETDLFQEVEDYVDYAFDYIDVEFIYLFREGQWFYMDQQDPVRAWHRVERALTSAPPC